jgi:hypothetical protein
MPQPSQKYLLANSLDSRRFHHLPTATLCAAVELGELTTLLANTNTMLTILFF